MKKIELTYNPFTHERTFLVDGKSATLPKCWGESGTRELSEWCGDFFQALKDKFNDSEMEVRFKGILRDWEFLTDAREKYSTENPSDRIALIDAGCVNTTAKLGELRRLFDRMHSASPFPELKTPELKDLFDKTMSSEFEMAVVATMSSGKSTLINALVGYRINAVKNTACTNKLCYLYNKPSADGVIVKREDGRFLYSCAIESPQKGEFYEAGLHFNSFLSECRICFIDTPGTNYSGNKSHGEITRKAIVSNNYDAVIFVVNSLQFNTEDEATLRDYVLKHTQKPIIFVLNQLDRFNPEDDSIRDTLDGLAKLVRTKKKTYQVTPLSAYYALLLKLSTNNCKLSRQEKIQMDSLKYQFQYDYYNLAKYCQDSNTNWNNSEITKTGITILESLIKAL